MTTSTPSFRPLGPGRRVRGALTVALVSALAACGSAGSGAGAQPARIRVVAGAPTAGARQASAAAGAPVQDVTGKDSGGPAEGRSTLMVPYRPVEYVLAGALPALTGEAPAWHLPARSTVDATGVSTLANALGLAGPVTAVPADQGGGWRVGPADGTGPTLTVQGDAAASWFYDGAGPQGGGKTVCAVAVDRVPAAGQAPDAAPGQAPDGAVAATTTADGPPAPGTAPAPVTCDPPAPPADLPTPDAARAAAVGLAARLGVAIAPAAVDVAGDGYARWTSWAPKLGAVASPLAWSASFGGGGRLVFASGSLATPVAAAPYPRIGTTRAFDLLKDQPVAMPAADASSGGGQAAAGVATPATAPAGAVGSPGEPGATLGSIEVPCRTAGTPAPTATAPIATTPIATMPIAAAPTATPASSAGSTGSAPGGVTPAEPSCGPEPVTVPPTTVSTSPPIPLTVSVTGVEAVLVPLYGVDGDVWFVPGYRFLTGDGGIVVPAIDASYIEQVAPADGGMRADVPVAGGPAVASPAPAVAKP